jgi:mannan endo-1,4-beta-mannosidase
MKRFKFLSMGACLLALCLVSNTVSPVQAHAASNYKTPGFTVSGTHLKDARGNDFIIRGIDSPNAWFYQQAYDSIPTLAATGANTIRVVWNCDSSNPNCSAARLDAVLAQIKKYKMIAIPEVHDVTGNTSESAIADMANFWSRSDYKAVLAKYKDCCIVNIANEWGDWFTKDATWRDAYQNGIRIMRNAGITNTLLVDADDWGQNPNCIINEGRNVEAADKLKNTMFSIHMYGNFNDPNKIGSSLKAMQDNGLCVIVGEFGYDYNNGNNNLGCQVDCDEIMAQCKARGIGYIPWSWTGNDQPNAWLDLVDSYGGNFTWWGNHVVNSVNGIRATAKPCSIYKDENSVLYNFNSSIDGWTGTNLADGPALTSEWNHNGSGSLKADINLANGANYYLSNPSDISLSGESQIQAVVRNVPGAKQESNMGAKLYIKTGNSTKCYYGDEVKVNSSKCGTVLNLNLTSVPNINNVTEIGVQFTAGANALGTSTIYLANVTAN